MKHNIVIDINQLDFSPGLEQVLLSVFLSVIGGKYHM
jgi:hypothetical protein